MRQLVILTQAPSQLTGTVLNAENFHRAKLLLGTERPYAFYDMRAENSVCFNLDALAILAGTIQARGTLFIICPQWQHLAQLIDQDSVRWNDDKPISCPNFMRHFQQCVSKYGFQVSEVLPELPSNSEPIATFSLTQEQQNILKNLPLDLADIHLITAPRGRGKSTLAGKLATQLAQTHSVLITARSQSVLPSFWRTLQTNVPFIAPDQLISQIQAKQIPANQWLFIDEAASLPLPMLHQCCAYFDKVVLTTTTHNYEGTGRGFALKFPAQLQQRGRKSKTWQLTTPLRWAENDPLEGFIDDLLLLGDSANTPLSEFYQLLAEAHYKTTPNDLRRLFDGSNQLLFPHYDGQNHLMAGIWAMEEGGLDKTLTEAIWRGERRPKGNLVAQYLCFQGNLPQACQLRSLRISRIAVTPEKQHQGIGKRLISDLILQITQQNRPLDFLSVSFGMSDSLLAFWLACGFQLVQITPTPEASSGLQSAMLLYPISTQGNAFVQHAVTLFQRNAPLLPYCQQNINPDFSLNEQDWQNLYGFAYAQRTFSACYASLKRLAKQYPSVWWRELVQQKKLPNLSKAELKALRQAIAETLK